MFVLVDKTEQVVCKMANMMRRIAAVIEAIGQGVLK